MSEGDNAPAWTGRPPMYEVWFLTSSDRSTGRGYWIRSTLHAQTTGSAHGAVWFARFDRGDAGRTFGIHRRYPMHSVKVAAEGFDVRIGETTFRSGHAEGAVHGGGRSARWRLDFPTGLETYRLLPDALYRGSLAPTRPSSPNVRTAVTGVIEVDGEVDEVHAVPAQQGHLVGTRHARRWAWAHCSAFEDEEAIVHALAAQGRRGPVTTPYLTAVGVWWEGRWIRLTKLGRRPDFGLGTWRVDVGNRRYRLSGRIEAPATALLRARYEDPDGTLRFCHNSEVASARLALFERKAGGFEEIALLESRGTTHAEWAGMTPALAVPHEHVEVTR